LVGEWHGRSRLHLQRRCHEQSGASGANHRRAPLKYETITQPFLERVRQFCQNQWPYGKPDEQCNITSVFLIHLFGGVLQGGFNYEGGKEIPGGGGYRDGRGLWQLHYWVKLRGSVIDLTSDQFHGGAPIVFEPDFHRYRSTFPDEHLKSVTEHQGIKLAAWLRNWAAYTNPTGLANTGSFWCGTITPRSCSLAG